MKTINFFNHNHFSDCHFDDTLSCGQKLGDKI